MQFYISMILLNLMRFCLFFNIPPCEKNRLISNLTPNLKIIWCSPQISPQNDLFCFSRCRGKLRHPILNGAVHHPWHFARHFAGLRGHLTVLLALRTFMRRFFYHMISHALFGIGICGLSLWLVINSRLVGFIFCCHLLLLVFIGYKHWYYLILILLLFWFASSKLPFQS